MNFREDPLWNAVYGGIKEDINLMLGAERFRGALILLYAGMDCMASIARPDGQEDVTRDDFIAWTERYIEFPGKHQLTGLDLYAARCALLHQYGIESRLSREGKCRQLGYADKMSPPVKVDPSISPDFVIVSIHALVEAFFLGTDRFVVDVFKDARRGAVAERRFRDLILELTLPRPKDR